MSNKEREYKPLYELKVDGEPAWEWKGAEVMGHALCIPKERCQPTATVAGLLWYLREKVSPLVKVRHRKPSVHREHLGQFTTSDKENAEEWSHHHVRAEVLLSGETSWRVYDVFFTQVELRDKVICSGYSQVREVTGSENIIPVN